MICEPCKEAGNYSHPKDEGIRKIFHGRCTNPATCTCQHREAVRLEDGTIAPVRNGKIVVPLQKGQEG